MAVSLYSFVGIYSRNLDTLAHILTQGAAFAASKGVSDAEMLEWRLIDDMFPLRNQAKAVLDFSVQWPARAAGLPIPDSIEGEPSLADLQAAITKAKTYLAGLKPEQFEGRDDVTATVSLGQIEPTLPMSQWITGFATTNYYFHLSMAYAILRAKGVQIGKRDLFAGGL